jgi:hypothetical protein
MVGLTPAADASGLHYELSRKGPEGVEAPVYDAGWDAPACVPDRTGHDDHT